MRTIRPALALLAAACAPGRDAGAPASGDAAASLAAAEAAVTGLRARLDSMTRVDAALAQGDAASSFSAYYEDGALRVLTESLDQGDYGRSEEEYFLVDGSVVYWAARGVRVRPGEPGAMDSVRWRVALDGSGGVVAAERLVNGKPAPLEESRAATIVNHAAELDRAARALGP